MIIWDGRKIVTLRLSLKYLYAKSFGKGPSSAVLACGHKSRAFSYE